MALPPIDHNGVKLRDPEDFDSLRSDIFDGVKQEVISAFPKSYGGVRLEVDDVDYEGDDDWDFAAQRKALLNDDFLAKKLKGTVRLFDEATGDLIEERRQSLMRVPWLTQRGTFIHKGNEYSTINQNRLVPGPYTRRTESGVLETHFNPRPGSGRGFRLSFDPESAQYRLGVQSSQLHLYSLLRDLGHSDDDLAERWGPDVLQANATKYDARVLPRAYKHFVPAWKQEAGVSRENMVEAVRGAISKVEVNRGVAERTLPNWFNRTKSASWAAKQAGAVAARTFFARAVEQSPFAPDMRPSELWDARAYDHIDVRADQRLLSTKRATTVERYGVTEGGRDTNLIDWERDQKGYDVHVPQRANPLLAAKHVSPDGKSRVFMLHDLGGDESGSPTAENRVGYVGVDDVDDDMAEVTALYTAPAHRRQGIGGVLLELLTLLEGEKHLIVQPDPFSDKAVSRETIEKLYKKQGYQPVRGTDGQEFLLKPMLRTKTAATYDAENPVYDWDGTLIPELGGDAKTYLDKLKELQTVTALGEKLKGMRVDIATARPPMFHRAMRDAAVRLGLDIGDIHHAGKDKTETIRTLNRRLIDNDPDVVAQLHANLGEESAAHAPSVVLDLPEDSEERDHGDIYDPATKKFYLTYVPDIWKQIEGRQPEEINLGAIWGGSPDSPGFSEERVDAADVDYPIILDDFTEGEGFHGGLVDGRHRKIKLERAGKATAKVIKLTPEDIKALIAKRTKQASATSSRKAAKVAAAIPDAKRTDGFDPDLGENDMQEAYDAVYGGSKPRLASMKSWPAEWMPPGSDSLGWINWYQQYLNGTRTDDDDRQIKRWKAFKARHGTQFKKNPTPRRAYALRYWAIDPLKLIDDETERAAFKDRMEDYRAKESERWLREKTASLTFPDLKLLANFLNTHHGAGIPLNATQPQIEDAIAVFLGADDAEASAFMGAADTIEKAAAVSRGCLMAMLPLNDAVKVVSWAQDNIPEADLADDGLERESHVTVLYGFETDVTGKELKKHLTDKPITFKLGKIKRFPASEARPDSDVIVVEVESEDLKKLNGDLVKSFEGRVSGNYFREYTPHMTLAYVKPGAVAKLDGHAYFDGQIYICQTLVFSTAGQKSKMTLKIE